MVVSHFITKADGSHEPFDPNKLEQSLTRAGAPKDKRDRVISRILSELKDGMTTAEIYRHAFDVLKEEPTNSIAARYSIKKAVFDLGPSGFPFEQFLAAVLRAHGWQTQTGVTLQGRCAPHEVDVLAQKDGKKIGIEAKFHNDPGGKTDIKDALYVFARYEDLKKAPTESSRVDEGWLVTNTRFTRNALRYGQCSNLTLIAWDYPKRKGLMGMIEEAGVHPLTSLTTLTDEEKRRLMENKVVLCKDITSAHLLEEYGVKPSRISSVLAEAKALCTPEFVDTNSVPVHH